jgi:hypothetical protein
MMSSVKQQIEAFGAGVFIRNRNTETRLTEDNFHRAYSEPVLIWFTPGNYQESWVEPLLDQLVKLHKIQRFRFPNVAVSKRIINRIKGEFPAVVIEGVKSNRR